MLVKAVASYKKILFLQNTQIPISHESAITRCILVPTSEPLSPVSDRSSSPELVLGSKFRFRNYFTPTVSRYSPLPKFSWAESREVWQNMMKKEQHYTRNPQVFNRHPTLQPRMRTILLDWLIEVSTSAERELVLYILYFN